MDIDSLRYFMNIAETLSFSKSAEIMNISQSSISKAIMRLEDELNVKLFDRKSHPVKLTEIGELFYSRLTEIAPVFNDTLSEIGELSRIKKLSVMVIPSSNHFSLKSIVRNFTNIESTLQFTILQKPLLKEVTHLLNKRELDYVILNQPRCNFPGYKQYFLREDAICALFPTNHRFAERDCLYLKDLEDEVIYSNAASQNIINELIAIYNFKPKRIVQSKDDKVVMMIPSIPYRNGVSIFRESDYYFYRTQRIVCLKIVDIVSPPLVLLENCKNENNILCQKFKEYIFEQMNNI